MQRKKRAVATVVILTFLIRGVVFPAVEPKLRATASTQQKIRDAEKEKQNIEEKLKDQKDDIGGLKKQKKSLQQELKGLNTDMTDIRDRLEDLEKKIILKNQEIEENQHQLELAIERERKQMEDMEIRVHKMYERNVSSYVKSLLNAGSFGKLLNLADWYERIESYDKDRLDEYKSMHLLTVTIQERLEAQRTELGNLKLDAEAEKNKVAGLISQVSGRITDYSGQISDAEAKALAYEAELRKAEEDIKVLKKKLEEELRLSRAAAQGKWRKISEVSFADGDRKLLANIIYCEAGSEPYEGKLAVGAVVINRVLSSKFPDTVVGVVYQRNQFSPASSGRLDLALAADKATSACYQAADEAMSGKTNVGTCVFFRTPIPGLNGIQIGNHIFY